MSGTVQFDLVSPERRLVSSEAAEVQLPGAEGDLTAMPGHTPLLTTLRPGIIKVNSGSEIQEYVISGGFADVRPDGISVLAEHAIAREECTPEMIEEMVQLATQAVQKARDTFDNEPGPVDDAAKLLSDMVAVGKEIGLN